MFEERFYRDHMGQNLNSFKVVHKETDLWIGVGKDQDMELLKNKSLEFVKRKRKQLDDYIRKDSLFLKTLKPHSSKKSAPKIVKLMAEAAGEAGVGPMASVAGAFSEYLGEYLMGLGARKLIVENGGDLFVSGFEELNLGIYAGESVFSDKIGLKVTLNKSRYGICTSAGTFGHSLSLGNADMVTIISRDPMYSDALATATANRIQTKDDVDQAIEDLKGNQKISGAVIIKDDKLGAFGNLEIIRK